MKVITFGIYSKEPEYPRFRNLLAGLASAEIEVHECRFDMAGDFRERFRSATSPLGMVRFLASLMASYASLSWQFFRSPQADAILIVYPGYFHVHFVKFLTLFRNRRAVLLYDVFFSLYDTLVRDRQLVTESSLTGRMIYRIDRSACRNADIVLVDTHAHASYLSQILDIDEQKCRRVFVGPTFEPYPEPVSSTDGGEEFNVLFVGTYIPLHGVETILRTARELADKRAIRFLLVGDGQQRAEMENLAKEWQLDNVRFRDWVPAAELGSLVRSSDLTLGIFGTTEKAGRVIPIKVFDICAAGVPFVTADTPAIREAFSHGENAYLVPPGDPEALAQAILELRTNRELRDRIAAGAHRLAVTTFSIDSIGTQLVKTIEEAIQKRK
jgi:glycosyltransferase involved in cell wall biosynthesis